MNQIINQLRQADRLITAVVPLWILMMIATPIFMWVGGRPALYAAINAGVLMQVLASLTVLWRAWNPIRTLHLALFILPLAWLAEFIGSHTGFPFGRYIYTDILQPQLLDVPLLIPLAWLMMLPPAWAVAALIVRNESSAARWQVRTFRALIAALAFTAWDLFLDPQMVTWDFWRWVTPGLYFGIPLINFLGWILVSFIFSYFFMPADLPVTPLFIIYIITWILQTIGQLFFWNLPGPALCGFIGMGAFILWAFRSRGATT
jgi:putative membrane protein